jgi:hypothetical protein
MPILSYFAVAGPALAALLWLACAYLEPATPVKPRAEAAPPTPSAPVRATPESPVIGSAVSYRAPVREKDAASSTPAEPAKAATEPAQHAAQKAKARKVTARRRQHRDSDEATAAASTRAYAADYQPFRADRLW